MSVSLRGILMQWQLNNLRGYLRNRIQKNQKIIQRYFELGWFRKVDPSQAGEAEVLRLVFGKDHIGHLVDIGAHDGNSLSNSSLLIDSGWKAILIEPLPGPFNKLARKYNQNLNVTCLNIAISNSAGKQKFFIGADGPEGMLSTLCNEENNWFAQARSELSIDVQVDTITNTLLLCNYPRNFDLLLVDAEGMDYECLMGMDFDLFCPRVIVTEIYQWNQEKCINKNALLTANGYLLYKTVGCNSVWVKKNWSC